MLNPVALITLLAFGAAGGWIGWRRGTKRIYRRSLSEPEFPPGMTRRDFDRQLRSRRKRWRLVWTCVCALAGVLVGAAIMAVLPRR